ncbi:MAG: hypothetical protein ACYCUM_14735 [Solirubrobacteraceae bacterium]
MPDEQPIPDLAERFDATERDVIYLLTGDDLPIWSVEDIGRDLEDPAGVVDAIRGLHNAGLIHKSGDGYVFATRAAWRMVQIVGQVI